ncbi:choice-of-anchor J domain-containing protein, partial [Arthrospira platensis SPKY1]|nr:choice-of-anchor J domain-containing protein [Arthrospira platensis SPKY1]
FAWIAFNPSQTDPPIDVDEPAYEGQKMAACIQYQDFNDDKWLISPELSFHNTSMLSFMARSITDLYGLERIRVLVSTSGTEPNDFTQISPGDFMEVPVDWTEFSFELGIYAGETGYIA